MSSSFYIVKCGCGVIQFACSVATYTCRAHTLKGREAIPIQADLHCIFANAKVKYLGNVQTAMMKGEGCVDKPVGVIWNNYLRSTNPGLDMRLTLTTCGLKAETREQGLTEYRAHRISYCIAHPAYPKLFNSVVPLRTKMLSTGQNFKPPISKSNTAPRLGAIHEDHEQEEEEGERRNRKWRTTKCLPSPTIDALTLCGHDTCELGAECRSQRIIDIEIGNDIDELKLDEDVKYIITRSGDSDDESSESSGFNEPDSKDGSLTAQDDNSLDGEDAVCETPSPPSPHIPDETEVTSF
ncbi:FA43A-like protein [Mya arenaria]|uniref:FA43A-like protein n=1 Tax=Mya arenaria TaxID=6604 RepID=A0ABY7G4M1_MYAAR|nr:FA43A-like protein [Mya arenaria]